MKTKLWILTLAAVLLVGTPCLVEAGWTEGLAAFKAEDWATAAKEFKALTDSKPEWAGGHMMLGWTYIKLDQTREAITHLRKAYDLDQGNPNVQLRLGQAYVAAGRYGDAVGFLSKIEASSLPADAQSLLSELKAVALSKSGQSGQALIEFKKVAQARPDDAQAQFQYGTAAYNENDLDTAISALEKAARLAPTDVDIQSAYARVLSHKGRTVGGDGKTAYYQKAIKAATVVVNANGSYENIMMLAEAELGAKNYDGAIQNLNRAAGLKTSDWLPQFYIGSAYTAKQQYKGAESNLKQSLDKARATSDKQRIWKQLAFVYEKQKKFDDAILAYNQAGDSAGAQRAQENRDTLNYNQDVEAQNAELQRLQAEQEAIKEQLKDLPGGPPPGI
jgi:Flp pilus assembly protein TadD